jgi:hypothetical protein
LIGYVVPIKKDDLDKYVRLSMTIKCDYEEGPMASEDYKDGREGPPVTDFGLWHRYASCKADESNN